MQARKKSPLKEIQIGWATTSITPDRPVVLLGQMYHRVSEYVRDPITATALALDNGQTQAVFVSLDLCSPPTGLDEELKRRLADMEDLHFENISIGATHTHSAATFGVDFLREDNEAVFGKDILPEISLPDEVLYGQEAEAFLLDRLEDVIRRAWRSRAPGGISHAQDYAVVGHNQRAMFITESGVAAVMHGDCSQDSFMGFENGVDSSVDMLYTWDMQGRLSGMVINVPCPSQVFELHRFVSADYWGFVREEVRSTLGNLFILPLCGAAGDINPIDLVRVSKHNKDKLPIWAGQTAQVHCNIDLTKECEGIAQRIGDAVRRGLRQAAGRIEHTPRFEHAVLHLNLPLRTVSEQENEEAQQELQRLKAVHSPANRMTMQDVVAAFEVQGVVMRHRLQQTTRTVPCTSHVARLGNLAIATNPFELYHSFGLRMKARVRADQLMIAQLSNGSEGYLPTAEAIAGGSYGSKAASTQCGPEGGDMLVEETIRAINAMFGD
jgi:hypothetical protein